MGTFGHGWTQMNTDKKLLAWIAFVPLCFGQTWIDEYVREAGTMNKVCGAKEWAGCREHLLRLEALLDGRVDIVYRLAKAEAMLGDKDAALRGRMVYSKSGLTFADPGAAAEFVSLKNSSEFEAVVARIK